MTEKLNKTACMADHTIGGGEITVEDFSTASPSRKRLGRQIDALEKSEQWKEKQRYMNMTLEELREMKIVSNTNGRPLPELTDEKWQKEFSIRKLFITPYSGNITRLRGKHSAESGKWNEETQGTYHGCTNWQEYCACINDMLLNIRSGQDDYCYFIYQIMELAKFHFDTLKTKYCGGYWKVWLER